jgi:hypothetical protein
MPARPSKPEEDKTEQIKSSAIENKANATAGKVKEQRIEASGLTNRIRGHVSAAGKRSQAKRDSN